MFASTIIKKYNTRRIKKAWKLFHVENYENARQKVSRLTSCNDKQSSQEANMITGLAFYRQKLYAEAIPYLKTASVLSNQQHDWYNLTMALAKANCIHEAEKSFLQIYRAKSKHDYQFAISLPTMIFHYMRVLKQKEAYEIAYQRVIELRSMYESLRKNDESVLLANGLPTIRNYLKEITPILENIYPEQKVNDWLKDFSHRVNPNKNKPDIIVKE